MILVVAGLFFISIPGLDACAPGLGFDQLRSSLLVGQTTNLTKDDPLSRAINFAVNSLDPNQPVTVKNLACEVFDNRCLWRTSNLSTVPWFQSNYKFDPNILKYATGTDIQPDGDYGISVVLSPNKTEYAVLESPSFCQFGNGYLQLLLWSSRGVRVQACSKANAANSFDYCTLFLTENEPGPFAVTIPQPSQAPSKIYIVATSFNYTDSQYSGGFVVVDQLSYIANDCPTSIPGPLDVSVPPAAPLVTFLVGSATTRAVTSSPISQVLPRPPNGTAAAEPEEVTDTFGLVFIGNISEDSADSATSQPYTTTYVPSKAEEEDLDEDNQEDGILPEDKNGPRINETDYELVMAMPDGKKIDSGNGQHSNGSLINDIKNITIFVFNLPDDVTAPHSRNSSNTTTAPYSVNSLKVNATTASPSTTITKNTTSNGPIKNSEMSETFKLNATSDGPKGSKQIQLPIPSNVVSPAKTLPERIHTLLYNETTVSQPVQETSKEPQPTSSSTKQETLVNQLYNGRKSILEPTDDPKETEDPTKEELPLIFHPSVNDHPRLHQKPNPGTTTQPPWHAFTTTLHPEQRTGAPSSLKVLTNQPIQNSANNGNSADDVLKFVFSQPASALLGQIQPSNSQPSSFYLNPSLWLQTLDDQQG